MIGTEAFKSLIGLAACRRGNELWRVRGEDSRQERRCKVQDVGGGGGGVLEESVSAAIGEICNEIS